MSISAHQGALPHVRVQTVTVAHLQMAACHLIIVAYFLSFWKYKTWYVATAGTMVLTAFAVVIGSVRIRGLFRDLWPLFLYYAYLILAAGQAEYAAEARYWALVDLIGFPVACMFWVAARNSEPSALRSGFIWVALVAAPVAILVYRWSVEASRLGGYALSFYPLSVPFLWAEIIARKRRRLALLALTVVLTMLFLSRSRTPLAVGLMMLGFSFIWIGRSIAQRLKLALVMMLIAVTLGVTLMSFYPTRVALLTFVARITHEDIVMGDIYIPGEPLDPTRDNLDAMVRNGIRDVQPFGAGYNTTPYYYERAYGSWMSLHNIYQMWAYEGGVFCALIMLIVLIRHAVALKQAHAHAPNADHTLLARCLVLATFAMLFIGFFHQMHHGPMFYAVLGMALGLRQRVMSNHWNTQEVRR